MTSIKAQRTRPTVTSRTVWLLVAVVCFVVPLVVDIPDLSAAGQRMLAIFLVAIVLWVAEPIPLYGTAALIIFLEIVMISDQSIIALPGRL